MKYRIEYSGGVSKGDACFGVDIQPTISAKGEKSIRLDYGSENLDSLALLSFLKLFREDNPLAEIRGHVLAARYGSN